MSKGHYLTVSDVMNVQTLLDANLSLSKISEITGISRTSINRIKKGEHTKQRPAVETGNDTRPQTQETTLDLLISINKKLDKIIESWE